MDLLERIKKLYTKYPALVIALAVIVALPMVTFAFATPVTVGSKTFCKYSHTIKDDTRTSIAFRWNADDAVVKIRTTICDKHKKLEELWAKAKKAQKEGDKKKALDLFKMIQAADPDFQNVDIVIADLASEIEGGGGGATPGGTDGATPDEGNEDQPGQPEFSGDITSLFPKSLDGYEMVNNAPGRLTASRLYRSDANKHPKVQLLTIQLDQRNTEALAQKYINDEIKSYYGRDSRATTVNGYTAYFGSDGQLSILAYHINGIVFLMEMQPASGVAPKDLFDDSVAVGNQVP